MNDLNRKTATRQFSASEQEKGELYARILSVKSYHVYKRMQYELRGMLAVNPGKCYIYYKKELLFPARRDLMCIEQQDAEAWIMFKEIGDERAFNGILNQIIDNIQNGELKAEDALPAERTMAETMGVSRPAVREVLRALELLGIVKPVPGGGNYITENLDTWLIGPLSILFKLNNGYLRQNQQFRAALERESAILAARKCTPLDAAELWMILARLDAAEDEKIRGELDRELHQKIAKIADNPMVYSVLAAADQLTENIVSGTRDYIMKKNNSAREIDDQHHRLVEAIINGDEEQAERCMSEHMDTIERYMEEMQKNS